MLDERRWFLVCATACCARFAWQNIELIASRWRISSLGIWRAFCMYCTSIEQARTAQKHPIKHLSLSSKQRGSTIQLNGSWWAGAGQGIGRAFAHALGEAGAAVAVVDVQEQKAQEVCQELSKKGVRCIAINADVTDAKACDGWVYHCLLH